MYVVSLKQFDGPLDLLLTLVTRAKIDIQDIFVSEITEQYLETMKGIDELDMDAASEFLTMAATLMEIKSRALLPTVSEEDEEEETPEQALIRQLTEYKAFKELSQDMRKLEEEARALISKLPEEYPLPPPQIELTGLTLDALARAFLRVLARAKVNEEEAAETRKIRRDEFTVQSCMHRIQSRLKKGPIWFSELFSEDICRVEVISVFLGLLELLKLNRARAHQEGIFGDIVISMPEE